MEFDKDLEQLFAINKKAHAVIISCKNHEHLEAAERYINIVDKFYDSVKCNTRAQSEYLTSSLQNLRSVLRIKQKKMQLN
jgi:hypothetical protein